MAAEDSVRLSQSAFFSRCSSAASGGSRRIGLIDQMRWNQSFQQPGRCSQDRGRSRGTAAIAWGQLRNRGGDGFGLTFILLQTLAIRDQLVFLIRLRCQRAEFTHRVAQPVLIPAGRLDRHFSRVQPEYRLAPSPPGVDHRLPAFRGNAKQIQKHAVAGLVGEAHLLVLTLDLDQQRADPPQQSDAGGLVVNESPRAAVFRDDPAQDDLVLTVQPLFGQ